MSHSSNRHDDTIVHTPRRRQLYRHTGSKECVSAEMSPQTTTEGRQQLLAFTRHIPLLLNFFVCFLFCSILE